MIPDDVKRIVYEMAWQKINNADETEATINDMSREDVRNHLRLGVAAKRAAARAVMAWLDSLPVMPQVDWSDAHPAITHHAYLADGTGIWLVGRLNGSDPRPSLFDWVNCYQVVLYSGLVLPLGLDWRLALTKRPEEKP